jgi:hypothetical protein
MLIGKVDEIMKLLEKVFRIPLALRVVIFIWFVFFLFNTIGFFYFPNEDEPSASPDVVEMFACGASFLIFIIESIQAVRLLLHRSNAVKMLLHCVMIGLVFRLLSYKSLPVNEYFFELIISELIVSAVIVLLLLSPQSRQWVCRMQKYELFHPQRKALRLFHWRSFTRKLLLVSALNFILLMFLLCDIISERIFINRIDRYVGMRVENVDKAYLEFTETPDSSIFIRRKRWFRIFWRLCGMDAEVSALMQVADGGKIDYLCIIVGLPSGIKYHIEED